MSRAVEQPGSSKVGTGEASGKVILFGEHAVVHGAPALAAGFRPGARARVHGAARDELVVNGEQVERGDALFVALERLRQHLVLPEARCELEVDVPKGAGLGSSAALAVATARALLDLSGRTAKERAVFEAAQAWEGVFHGNPSGVDVAAAQRTGLLSYRRGEDPVDPVLGQPLTLVIAQAGPPASTKLMVEGVAQHKKRNPGQFQRTLEAITAVVQNAEVALRQGALTALGQLLDLNHILLAGWLLSTEDLERAIRVARQAGALGAKLTGAGGGGCIVALSPDQDTAPRIVAALEEQGIRGFVTHVGPPHRDNAP